MAVEFRGLLPDDTDPILRYIIKLQNKINKTVTDQQVASVSSDNEDIFANFLMVESAVKMHTFHGVHVFDFLSTSTYTHPLEPDLQYLVCWIKAGRATGNIIKDQSGFHNDASVHGDPILVDGTLNLGLNTIGTKSTAVRYNRPGSIFENDEYITIPDASNIQTDAIVTGFSEFIRVRPLSIDEDDGMSITLIEKIDDSTPNDARMLQVRDTGRLLYVVKDGGTTYAKWTATNTVTERNKTTGLPFDIVCTYTVSGHVIHIYVDGVDQTLTDFTGSVNWHDDLTNHELNLFRRGKGSSGGHVYGDLYDYRLYAEKVLSSTEVTRLYTNKLSISNIGFGKVAVIDHCATWTGSGGAPAGGFDSVGFDGNGFDVT